MLVYLSDVSKKWNGEALYDPDLDMDVRHPYDIRTKWTKEELNRVGLAKLIDQPSRPPEDQRVAGYTDVVVDGEVHRQYTYEDIPAPTPAEIEESNELRYRAINEQLKKLLFIMANEIRELQSQPALSPDQFREWVKNL